MSERQWAKVRYLDASALVELVIDEGTHQPVRSFFRDKTNFCATSLCIMEALGVIKSKWSYGHITEDQYFHATHELISSAWRKRIEVEDIGFFSPQGLEAVEALAKKHKLDLSDALQLETILRGKYAHLGPNSASILITADAKLADIASYMTWSLRNCGVSGSASIDHAIYSLLPSDKMDIRQWQEERFGLFTNMQAQAIAGFLDYMAKYSNGMADSSAATDALKNYWEARAEMSG